MKRLLFFLFALAPLLAWAQYPNNPNKIRLGNQTSGDGLTFRGSGSPAYTPSSVNNAWMFLDTISGTLYAYRGGSWQSVSGADTNIGNTDLTLSANRRLNTNGKDLWIQDGTGAQVPYIFLGGDVVSFAASLATSVYIDSSDQKVVLLGGVVDIDADSVRLIGTHPNDNSLNRLLALDTITNRLHYVDKASITTPDTHLGNSDLTQTDEDRAYSLEPAGGTLSFYNRAARNKLNVEFRHSSGLFPNTGVITLYARDSVTTSEAQIQVQGAGVYLSGQTKDNSLNRLLAIDSLTGLVRFVDKASIAGGGGTVTGIGTTGTIPVWSSSTALGDSPLTVASGNVTATGTGAFRLPNGTDAQRPGTPTAGMLRYSTTNGVMEWYGASAWERAARSASATGLGTATRIPFADATGRLTDASGLTWNGASLNITPSAIGTSNTFVRAGNLTLSGAQNTGIGSGALSALTTGNNNMAIGTNALLSVTTRSNNTAIGVSTLQSLVTGGEYNTAIGSNTLQNLSSGAENLGIGGAVLLAMTSGDNNTAIGSAAMQNGTNPSNNTAIGRGTLRYGSSHTGNVAIGNEALGGVSASGIIYSTAIGFRALNNSTTGDFNVGIGYQAGLTTTTGSSNVIIGDRVNLPSITGNNQLVISNLIFGTGATGTGTTVAPGARIGINEPAPARTFHVAGEARITDLNTDNPTRIVGADADGDLDAITLGTGLSLSNDTLNVTATGTTNLSFTGSSSPVTLNSSTGTDVIFAAGSGLSLTQSGGTATYARTYSLTTMAVSGGSTTVSNGTPERPDNDTGGSVTTSTIGSDFSVSGATIDYTGAGGALLKITGTINFYINTDDDIFVSIYDEGSEIAASKMRLSCLADQYYTITMPTITTTGSTNDTYEIRVEPATATTFTVTSRQYGFIIERIY